MKLHFPKHSPRWQTVTSQVFIYHAKPTEKILHTFIAEN